MLAVSEEQLAEKVLVIFLMPPEMYKPTSDLWGKNNSTHELPTTNENSSTPGCVVFIINAPVTQQRIPAISLMISKRAQRYSTAAVYVYVTYSASERFVYIRIITFCFSFSFLFLCYITHTALFSICVLFCFMTFPPVSS